MGITFAGQREFGALRYGAVAAGLGGDVAGGFTFTRDGRIGRIDLTGSPAELGAVDIVIVR